MKPILAFACSFLLYSTTTTTTTTTTQACTLVPDPLSNVVGPCQVEPTFGTWVQVGADIDGVLAGESSGSSVAMSSDGSIVAVGSGVADLVRVYGSSGGVWTQLGNDIVPDTASSFGTSLALSSNGNTLAVGAPVDGGDSGGRSVGRVRTYSFDSTDWVQFGEDFVGEANFDRLGSSVALSGEGNILAIGAEGSDRLSRLNSSAISFITFDDEFLDCGSVSIYGWNGTGWEQRGRKIFGNIINGNAGHSVALSTNGRTVAIGAPGLSGGSLATPPGHVQVHWWTGLRWVPLGRRITGGCCAFGDSVSLSSNGLTLAAGGYGESVERGTAAGIARVYEFNDLNWQPKGFGFRDTSDTFLGFDVKLSGSGNVLAFGAPLADGVFGNETFKGRIAVFEYVNNDWAQRGQILEGDAAGDRFGSSVALSTDGTILAGGGWGSDDGANGAGHVKIFLYA